MVKKQERENGRVAAGDPTSDKQQALTWSVLIAEEENDR